MATFPVMQEMSSDAAAVVRQAILRIDPVERMHRMLIHSETMRDLALSRLRTRHPHRPILELVEMLLGQRLTPADRAGKAP